VLSTCDVHRPRDNEDYLGHVVTTDHTGRGARAHAEAAVGGLRLALDDGSEVRPLGVPGQPAAVTRG
jgi:hypothetical protein